MFKENGGVVKTTHGRNEEDQTDSDKNFPFPTKRHTRIGLVIKQARTDDIKSHVIL